MQGWHRAIAVLALLTLAFAAQVPFAPQPAFALSLNPLDYYSFEYHIAISPVEVEPEESFSVSAGATVQCIRDLPFGIREAVVRFDVLARPSGSGPEVALYEGYEVEVGNVPDWAGDEYELQESIDLAFPAGTAPGSYVLVGRLAYVSLDGWNVTSMVPSSARTISVGTITCVVEEAPPTPPPAPKPGVLTIHLLGHEFLPSMTEDGALTEAFQATLVEGALSLSIQSGTRCADSSGEPLSYLSATRESSPRAYDGGAVLSAFNLYPDGARFNPALQLSIPYDPDELPPECEPADLSIGYYDRSAGIWQRLPSSVNEDGMTVSAGVSHFTTYGLLAPVTTPGPARFAVRELDIAPLQVAPFGRVTAAITVANTGDTRDSYPLEVNVNGQREHAQEIDLGPRQDTTVRFTVVRSAPGTYRVSVEQLERTFEVISPADSTSPTTAPSQPGQQDAANISPLTPENQADMAGMHPVYVALLILAALAFLTLVILVLAGVL
jgi:hypothetical protein